MIILNVYFVPNSRHKLKPKCNGINILMIYINILRFPHLQSGFCHCQVRDIVAYIEMKNGEFASVNNLLFVIFHDNVLHYCDDDKKANTMTKKQIQ